MWDQKKWVEMKKINRKSLGSFQGLHKYWSRWGIVALVGLPIVLFAILYFLSSDSTVIPLTRTQINRQPPPTASTVPSPPVESPPLLEIGVDEWTWKRSDGSAVVSGQVRNISAGNLMNVVAEVSFYDKDGRFITSAEAFIFPTPIPAGQTVNFEIQKAWDPAIKEAKVSFQELFGYPIKTRWKQP